MPLICSLNFDNSIEAIKISIKDIKSYLSEIDKKITLFVYFLFQVYVEIFTFNLKAAAWHCKNFKHLQEIPAFCFTSPPLFSKQTFSEPFLELLDAYKELNKIPDNDLKKQINALLKKGFCHAQTLKLVQLVQENNNLLSKQISMLKNDQNTITMLEMLEIFRPSFEFHNKADLLEKLSSFLPSVIKAETYNKSTDEISFKKDLAFYTKSLVVARLYNNKSCHSILLSIDTENNLFSFYNSSLSGYYEYYDYDSFFSAFTEHAAFYSKYPHLNLAFFESQK